MTEHEHTRDRSDGATTGRGYSRTVAVAAVVTAVATTVVAVLLVYAALAVRSAVNDLSAWGTEVSDSFSGSMRTDDLGSELSALEGEIWTEESGRDQGRR